jgi:hypothetical protein
MVPPKAIPRMGVTSGEGEQSGEQETSRASAEPIELGAIKNREKVLRERAEKEVDLLSAASPRAKQHSPTPSIRISTAHAVGSAVGAIHDAYAVSLVSGGFNRAARLSA